MKAVARIGNEWLALDYIVRVTLDPVRVRIVVYLVNGWKSEFLGDDAKDFLSVWWAYCKGLPGSVISSPPYVPNKFSFGSDSGTISRGDFSEGAD